MKLLKWSEANLLIDPSLGYCYVRNPYIFSGWPDMRAGDAYL